VNAIVVPLLHLRTAPAGQWRCESYSRRNDRAACMVCGNYGHTESGTLFEMYYDKKLDLGYLRIFGCRVYTHLEEKHRKK